MGIDEKSRARKIGGERTAFAAQPIALRLIKYRRRVLCRGLAISRCLENWRARCNIRIYGVSFNDTDTVFVLSFGGLFFFINLKEIGL